MARLQQETSASGPSTPERRPAAHRKRWALVGATTLALLVVFCLPAALPLRLAPIAADWPPSTRDAGRQRATRDTLVTRGRCEPVTVAGRRDVEVVVSSRHPDRGLGELKGTLSLPVGPPPPHPGVIVIGGSGGHPRNPELRGGLVVHHEPFRTYFSSYYFSDRRRARLAEDHPEAASFFAEMEMGEPRCPG